MKLSSLALAILTISTTDGSQISDFEPERVTFDFLTHGGISGTKEPLLDALTSEGVVSITDIPQFADMKKSVMTWLHSCIIDQGSDAAHVLKTIEKDGTIRRTFGSKTKPGLNGQMDFMLKSSAEEALSPSCVKFSENLNDFRSKVGEVTKAFAERLTAEMGNSYTMPIMTTEDGEGSFETIADIVSSGEHLEHFHSYQKVEDPERKDASLRSRTEQTIELHTDQGFFIAFAPGLMVTHTTEGKPDLESDLYETEGFYIEKADGSTAHVHFSADDDLVFMMGDGANQYVNPMITNSRTLRAVPHSVSLNAHEDNLSRAWFGRMVLPPENGLDKNGKSYGDVRHLLMTSENSVGSLGCSNIEHRALSAGGEGCHGAHCIDVCDTDAGTFFCWFRCMNLEEHSAHECDSVGLPIQCINPRDQVSDGFKHGDYYPACSDSTANVTDYPKLEQYPQDPDVCTDAEWTAFSDSSDYMHVFDLSTDFTTAKFMWTVNAEGLVEGRIAFNGLFGWLAVGLLNLTPGAGHKGMNGASILMAVPGGDYTAADGFDLSLEPAIKEYKIDEYGSAHRHWQTPIADSTSSVSTTLVNNDECFTSFEFVADGINSIPFNTSGSDVLLWAGNTEDYYAGYHGLHRARFEVNWATGDAKFVVDETDDDKTDDGEEGEEESSSSKLFVSTSIASVALLSAMLI